MTNQDDAAFREYRDALMQALAGGDGVRDGDTLLMLRRLADEALAVAPEGEGRREVESLQVAAALPLLEDAIVQAQRTYDSAGAFKEAVFFARCLVRRPEETLRALQFRRYAEAAVVSADLPDLATDREVTLSRTTFEEFWKAPDLGAAAMLDWLQIWRKDFIFIYHMRHAAFQALVEDAVRIIDATLAPAEAVARLNGIDGLGAPLGVEAVAGVLDLAQLRACDIDAELLAEALEFRPSCPRCRYELGQQAPASTVQRLRGEVDKALAGQQSRLAHHVVSKLLLQPVNGGGEQLERFIQVVQASDLTGLAMVLDDTLIDFLRGVVDEAPDFELGVLQRLAQAYPEVSSTNIDAAVGELRRLLEAEVASGGVAKLKGPV